MLCVRVPAGRVLAAVVIAAVAIFSSALLASPARAHGKEVRITLRCAAPDPSRPLERLCEALVVYTSDGEPATDAELTLTAVRLERGGAGVSGVRLVPAGQGGRYTAAVSLPAYGTWQFTVVVAEPAEGKVLLDQEVLPPGGRDGVVSQVQVKLVQGWELRDFANLAALVLHLGGTLAIFVANGVVAALGNLDLGPAGIRLRRTAARLFPRAGAASLALLALSGAYNAAYNSPTRSPGLFDPGRVASLPYGDAYVASFAIKMTLAAALVLGTALLARRIRSAPAWQVLPVAGAAMASTNAPRYAGVPLAGVRLPRDGCARLAVLNLGFGGAILLMVVLMDYLHLLSHASALLGGG